jgi:hypothetical protein
MTEPVPEPAAREPFAFRPQDFGSAGPSLEGAVFLALGAASVCWENPGGAGAFDATRAEEIGHALLSFIRENTLPAPAQSTKHNPDAYLVKENR